MLEAGLSVDRYELVCPVGEGGMAEVWVARQRGKHGFSKLFALKAIHARYADQTEFRHMFLDEARIASAIEHPNVAQVFDLGENGTMLYLVMEYVDGESLAAILTAISKRTGQRVQVPPPVALRIMADVCAGLHAAHRLVDESGKPLSVVHRDVSPQNVLLSVKGDTKLIDFGIAHAADRLIGDTDSGALKGKLHYMAPEQARHKELGPFSDVFSAGAVLYRMLAGRAPFDAESDAATLGLLLSGNPPPPLPDSVPPIVASIVERALQPDPGDRYATAFGMQSAIEAVIAEEGYVPNVQQWVKENLSEKYASRKAMIQSLGAAPPPTPSKISAPSLPVAEIVMPTKHSAGVAPGASPGSPASPVESQGQPPSMMSLSALAPDVIPASLAEVANMASVPTAPPPKPNEIRSFAAATQEPPLEIEGPRSFMDLAAIAKQRALEAEDRARRPASAKSGTIPLADETRPIRGRLKPVAQASWRPWVIGAGVVGAIVAVVAIGGPIYVKSRIVAAAREAGVELTYSELSVGFTGASIKNVSATSATVPSTTLKADEIAVVGLGAKKIRIIRADVSVTGRPETVAKELAKFQEQNSALFAGKPDAPRQLSIESAHVGWAGIATGTHLDASDVTVDVESKAPKTEEVRASVGRFLLTTPKTKLGPWTATGERTPTSTRVRVVFDPAIPDGPSMTVLGGSANPPTVTVKIPRSPLANLGIKPEELGLPADASSELEVKIEGSTQPSGRNAGRASIYLWGARFPMWKAPVDVKLDGEASGAVGKPLELERSVASVGPFVAIVSGTLTPTADGFTADGSWKTQPIACEKLAKAEAKNLGAFVASLQEIARATGAVRVTGSATANGTFAFDSKTPDQAVFTVVAKETCGIRLFGN